MRKIFAAFLLLAVVSLVILINGERERRSVNLTTALSAAVPPNSNGTPDSQPGGSDQVPLSAAAPVKAGPEISDQEKLRILEQILASRDDNDPRLDLELRYLSEPLRRELESRYREIPVEKRNDRGMLVFLIGRNLQTPADFGFVRSVLSEAPCLSLADCKASLPKGENDGVGDAADEVTLAYPQWVALSSLERYLAGASGSRGSVQWNQALQALQAASRSRVSSIAEKATELFRRFSSPESGANG